MPTVLRDGPYRFYFYSHEPNEPPHIHVDRDDRTAKFWLTPVALAKSYGFSPKELHALLDLTHHHRERFCDAWTKFFGS